MTRRKGKWTGRGSLSLKYDRGWFESKSGVILFFFGKMRPPAMGGKGEWGCGLLSLIGGGSISIP